MLVRNQLFLITFSFSTLHELHTLLCISVMKVKHILHFICVFTILSQFTNWNIRGCNAKSPWQHLDTPGSFPSSSPSTHTCTKTLGVMSLSHIIMPPVWSGSVAGPSIRKLTEQLTEALLFVASLSLIFLSYAAHHNLQRVDQMVPGYMPLLWLKRGNVGRYWLSHARKSYTNTVPAHYYLENHITVCCYIPIKWCDKPLLHTYCT